MVHLKMSNLPTAINVADRCVWVLSCLHEDGRVRLCAEVYLHVGTQKRSTISEFLWLTKYTEHDSVSH